MAPPLYTLVDRQASARKGGAWCREYKGRFQNGAESGWTTEEDALDSFTPMQLDVFHAMWELYHDKSRGTRPPTAATRMQRDALDRAHALSEVPVGMVVWRDFVDQEGKTYRHRGVIYDYKPPYYRIRRPDGDRDELTETEVNRGMERTFQRGNIPTPGAKEQGGFHGEIL